MSKLISFSLWRKDPKYTVGAIKNAELAKTIYPGWICSFYCGDDIPDEIMQSLQSFDNVEIVIMDEPANWSGMFWRFYACNDADIMLSRDTDSRLSNREKEAVDEWLASGYNFHIQRDHPLHKTRILGGTFGVKSLFLKGIKSMINEFRSRLSNEDFYQVDQIFLEEYIYPIINNTVLIHDDFHFYKDEVVHPFPSPKVDRHFVGEIFDANDQRHPEHYLHL